MTPQEAALYLRLNPRTVVRLAREGKIPGTKVGHRWRFEPEKLASWVARREWTVPGGQRPSAGRRLDDSCVSALVRPELVFFDLEAADRRGVLSEITSRLSAAGVLTERERFLELLLEREELMTTAVFDGVAIPHPRRSAAGMFGESMVAVGISSRGVDFAGTNEAPVRLFLIICAKDDRSHLEILARLSHMLKDTSLAQRIVQAGSAEGVISIMARREEVLRAESDVAAG